MSTINFENTQGEQQAVESKAQRDEVNARAWHSILAKFPLRDTQANFGVIADWSKPNAVTLEAFEELLRVSPKSLDMSSRDQIIDDIVQHSHGDTNELRQLRFRLSTYSLAQLRQKRRDIDFKQEVHTYDAAKKFVASARNIEIGWRGTGYPKLASKIVPRGEVHAVPTGQYLRQLAKTSLWDFKRMVKIYSSSQIDYWLAQADDRQ